MFTNLDFTYPATFEADPGGGYVVAFPDLPEANTQGDDDAEARANAIDCLDEAIAGRIDDGEDIPTPSKAVKGTVAVPLPALTAMKAAVHMALRESGRTKADLARALAVDYREVQRILDPRHRTHIDRLEAALEALGHSFKIGLTTAA